MDTDPELAHKHGIAAAHHAGRLAVVRESAGYAAYRAGHYEIALKELRAAHRISGDVAMCAGHGRLRTRSWKTAKSTGFGWFARVFRD